MPGAKKKSELAEPEVTGVFPNPVTHVPHDDALGAVVAAMDRELTQGRQFYAMKVAHEWAIFYHDRAAVH